MRTAAGSIAIERIELNQTFDPTRAAILLLAVQLRLQANVDHREKFQP
jgi:hypothetical protein